MVKSEGVLRVDEIGRFEVESKMLGLQSLFLNNVEQWKPSQDSESILYSDCLTKLNIVNNIHTKNGVCIYDSFIIIITFRCLYVYV